MVLGQYNLVLLVLSGTGLVKRAFMPVYIQKKWRFGQVLS